MVLILLLLMGISSALTALEYGTGDIPLSEAEYRRYMRELPAVKALPESYDARDDGIVTSPKNQGACGSCWAFASVGAFESHIMKEYAFEPIDLSEQQLVSCHNLMSGCCGGSMTAIRWWETNNPVYESCFPYGELNTSCPTQSTVPCWRSMICPPVHFIIKDYHTIDTSSEMQVKSSLYSDGPTYFRYDFYQDFYDFWSTGNPGDVYLNSIGSTKLGGHAVLIIGWDNSKEAYLLKNSWAATGGPNGDGTFWMAYNGHGNDLQFGMANFNIEQVEWETVYKRAFDNAREIIPMLRTYRDEVLMSDPQGRELVSELYQKHSMELANILITHPLLLHRCSTMIKSNISKIEKSLKGGGIELTPLELAALDRLLGDIAKQGSPQLKDYLESIQKLVKDGELYLLKTKASKKAMAPGLKKSNLTTTWGSIKRNMRNQ
jgi:hypothetical protein